MSNAIAVSEQLELALQRVSDNTDEEWRQLALDAVLQVCKAMDTFICDDVWNTGLPSTHNDKALGPVMRQAKKNGWCISTDRVRPSVRSHLSGKPVWMSLMRGTES